MTNIQKIKFDAKYTVHYMNEYYLITHKESGNTLYCNEDELEELINSDEIYNNSLNEWNNLVSYYSKNSQKHFRFKFYKEI